MTSLFLCHFYPVISCRRVRKKQKATNYCTRVRSVTRYGPQSVVSGMALDSLPFLSFLIPPFWTRSFLFFFANWIHWVSTFQSLPKPDLLLGSIGQRTLHGIGDWISRTPELPSFSSSLSIDILSVLGVARGNY